MLLNHVEDLEVEIQPEDLFSLEDASNLSELTLDMERSESCAIRDSIYILSTLDPVRSSRLGKITLEARYVSRWFNKDGPIEVKEKEKDEEEGDEEDWEGLDTVLSKLAKVSINMRGKRLAFILVVLKWSCNEELVSATRKWLPKLMPRFNELGSLHVHYERGGICRAIDEDCLYHDKSIRPF